MAATPPSNAATPPGPSPSSTPSSTPSATADDAPRSTPGGRRRGPTRREENRRRPSPSPDRPTVLDFDDFYLSTRRRLLLQCLALTGNLATSRTAVRDAYVAAYHHWRKVSRLPDPESWVRPRAWATAQRRSAAHLRHREKNLDAQQSAVLEALGRLSDPQRKSLLLAHLAALPMDAVGPELSLPRAVVEQHLQQASAALALDLGCESAAIRTQLESLAPTVTSPGLPRVTSVRRNGVRRRRWHAFGGSALALALVAGAGWLVSTEAAGVSPSTRIAAERPVRAAMLLSAADLAVVAPTQWRTVSTGGNTSGSGLLSMCQTRRFADPHGLTAWTRTFAAPGGRTGFQSVEVSATPGTALTTYRTTLAWYADCAHAGVRLDHSYRINGLGDEAVALELTVPSGRYLVAIARSDQLVETTLVSTPLAKDPATAIAHVAAAGMHPLCRASAVKHCRTGPVSTTETLVPSGEVPGMLATVDMPVLAKLDKAWVGTDRVTGGENLASTPCDSAVFTGGGRAAYSRSFLVPNAGLPARFGLTETYARFAGTSAATSFTASIAKRMNKCGSRSFGSKVDHSFSGTGAGSAYSGWHLTTEINAKKTTVSYWMGIVRVGDDVAQVGFAPAGDLDLDQAAFTALIQRARDRLALIAGGSA